MDNKWYNDNNALLFCLSKENCYRLLAYVKFLNWISVATNKLPEGVLIKQLLTWKANTYIIIYDKSTSLLSKIVKLLLFSFLIKSGWIISVF